MILVHSSLRIGKKQGPRIESLFLRSLESFDVQAPSPPEWKRIAELVEQYKDFPLGGTDASVAALAERFDTELAITLDRKHFSAVEPRHRRRFRLLP